MMRLPLRVLTAILAFALGAEPTVAAPHRAVFLEDEGVAMQARVDIIQQARREILVEYFIVADDDQSLGGMMLLVDAAKRGVKVRVVLDSLFARIPTALYSRLMEKGRGPDGKKNLEIKVYSPVKFNPLVWTKRDHAKQIVVDRTVLLTGGRNVENTYFGLGHRNFDDLDILIKGEVALTAAVEFEKVWTSAHVRSPSELGDSRFGIREACNRSSDPELCRARQGSINSSVRASDQRLEKIFAEMCDSEPNDLIKWSTGRNWFEGASEVNNAAFLSHEPESIVDQKTARMNDQLLAIVGEARSRVDIVAPYLIPTRGFLALLQNLQDRRVRVRIVTNSLASTDGTAAQVGYLASKRDIIKLGVELYEYRGPNTIHAKTASVDRQTMLIGTYNIDPRSAFLNREIGVVVYDGENSGLADVHERFFQKVLDRSRLVAKDGEEKNVAEQEAAVTPLKRLQVFIYSQFLPLIRPQL